MSLVASRSNVRTAALPAVGSRCVGDWELVAEAGRGEFATVFRARPAGRADATADYAVKMARRDRPDAAACAALLGREADVAARVAHANLVALLAADFLSETPYLVMPWLQGATLGARFAAGQRFALPVALAIARQTAGALAALAEQGYRHGDVKPSNLMLSPAGHVTLLDLGFACHRDEDAALAARHWLGTPSYAAPERFTSRLGVTPQSDVYSLGVVLFQLLSGRLPFDGASLEEIAAAQVRQQAFDLRALRAGLPIEVCRLVTASLAKDPLRRPTARELVDALARLEIAALANRGL